MDSSTNWFLIFDVVLKFELPNAHFLIFPKNSAQVLINRDCVYCTKFLIARSMQAENGTLITRVKICMSSKLVESKVCDEFERMKLVLI